MKGKPKWLNNPEKIGDGMNLFDEQQILSNSATIHICQEALL